MNSIRCFLTAELQRERFRILTETRFEAEDYHKDSVALQFQEMLFVTSFNLQPRKIILGSSIELPKKMLVNYTGLNLCCLPCGCALIWGHFTIATFQKFQECAAAF